MLCTNDVKIHKKNVRIYTKIAFKSSKRRPRGVQNDPSGPIDAERSSKWHPRDARLDLFEF